MGGSARGGDVPSAVVVEAAGLLEHAGQLDAARTPTTCSRFPRWRTPTVRTDTVAVSLCAVNGPYGCGRRRSRTVRERSTGASAATDCPLLLLPLRAFLRFRVIASLPSPAVSCSAAYCFAEEQAGFRPSQPTQLLRRSRLAKAGLRSQPCPAPPLDPALHFDFLTFRLFDFSARPPDRFPTVLNRSLGMFFRCSGRMPPGSPCAPARARAAAERTDARWPEKRNYQTNPFAGRRC